MFFAILLATLSYLELGIFPLYLFKVKNNVLQLLSISNFKELDIVGLLGNISGIILVKFTNFR